MSTNALTRNRPKSRDEQIIALYKEGVLSNAEIGARFGLTKQRVDQIRAAAGIPPRGRSKHGLQAIVEGGKASGERVKKTRWGRPDAKAVASKKMRAVWARRKRASKLKKGTA